MDIERDDSLRSSLDVLWWFLEPLMQKNDNFPFLKKLVESVKQAVDAQDPFNDVINERLYAICDLAFGVINVKCASVKLPPFPGEVKLSVKFFAPPESNVTNTKLYIPEKYDFSPHRVPVAVEMEIDHPTVKKHVVKAAEIPLKKKSLMKKKFGTKKKIVEEDEDEELNLEEELDEHVLQEEEVEDEDADEEAEFDVDLTLEQADREQTAEEELEKIAKMEKKKKEAKKLKDSLTAKAKIKPKIVLKKQHVSQEELFPDPVLPKLKQSKQDNRPQKVMYFKTKAVKQKQKFSTDFDTMYEEKRQKEIIVPLPEKRLTLISTRRQKRIGMDQVEVGESPATYDIKKNVYVCSTPKRLELTDDESDLELNKEDSAESADEVPENDYVVEADDADEASDDKENDDVDLPSPQIEETPVKKASPMKRDPVKRLSSPVKRDAMDVSMNDPMNVSMNDPMDVSMVDEDEPEIKIKRRKTLRRGES